MNHLSLYDELDCAIDQIIAGRESVRLDSPGKDEDPEPRLADLVEIAADLRDLPRSEFKMRLKLELDWQASGRLVSSDPVCSQNVSSLNAPAVPDNKFHSAAEILPSLFSPARGTYAARRAHFAASVGLHAVAALLIGAAILLPHKAPRVAQEKDSLTPLVSPYAMACCSHEQAGGSGGAAEKTDASKGALTASSREQLVPPVVLPPRETRLAVQSTIVAADPNLPHTNQIGDPLSALAALSNGRGFAGGIGDHSGGGVGNGLGNRYGPGGDGDVYAVGIGVSAPRVIYNPEPDFSEEARKAKFQGTVTLWAIIGADGRPRNIRVARSLGMGLDEKAVEGVSMWRFQPGMKNGRPVAVEITVEVDFHLF